MAYMNRRQWLSTTTTVGLGITFLPALLTRAEAAEEMILVPEGAFLMGTAPDDILDLARKFRVHPTWLGGEAPAKELRLKAFLIDKHPVTNRLYREFILATGRPTPHHWLGGQPPPGKLDHPVVQVHRADARAFASWAGKRLPTEAEWEKAARGTDGRLFPWGNKFNANAAQWDSGGPKAPSGTVVVGSHPKGASPYGVMDMSGNVLEWCADGPGPGSAYLKGGSWLSSSPLHLRCASHSHSGFDNNQLDYVGFRCVKDV